jgi:hypothetical protein
MRHVVVRIKVGTVPAHREERLRPQAPETIVVGYAICFLWRYSVSGEAIEGNGFLLYGTCRRPLVRITRHHSEVFWEREELLGVVDGSSPENYNQNHTWDAVARLTNGIL